MEGPGGGSLSWLYALTFQNDGQRGWAVGTDGTILRTQDSGNTWQALSNGSKSRLFAVTFQGNGRAAGPLAPMVRS